MTAYAVRRRSAGGRVVHATRLEAVDGKGVQVAACGVRADAELPEPRTAAITCPACNEALEQQVIV